MNSAHWFIIKIGVSALLIAAISELGKRNSMLAALLASLPLISLLAMFWLYAETQDTERVAEMTISIFWLILPSLALFIALPLLLRKGVDFYLAMAIAITITVACYIIMLRVLNYFGIQI